KRAGNARCRIQLSRTEGSTIRDRRRCVPGDDGRAPCAGAAERDALRVVSRRGGVQVVIHQNQGAVKCTRRPWCKADGQLTGSTRRQRRWLKGAAANQWARRTPAAIQGKVRRDTGVIAGRGNWKSHCGIAYVLDGDGLRAIGT